MAYIGVSPSNGVRQKHTYTATASQTTFSGAGSEGISLSYRDSNYVDVYRNGVKLGDADYTATSGTSIVLGEGAAVNDIVEIVVYDVFSVADTVSKADGGTFDGNVAMAGTLAVTGETTLSANLNLGDNDKAIFGAGDDLQLFHDGSNSYINDTGTGDLVIRGNGLRLEDSNTNYAIRVVNGAEVDLRYNGSKKLETTSTGIDVTGVITTDGMTTSADINFGDNDKAVFGDSSDLEIYHSGTNSFITEQGTGSLYVSATNLNFRSTGLETYLTATENGAVALYYDNVAKLATTSHGISVTGSAVASSNTYTTTVSNLTANFDTYQNFIWTLDRNITLANPSTEKVGQSGFFVFIQDGTGGRTVSLGTDYETAGGAGLTLSSTASATDVVPYIVVASNRILLGTPQLAFS